MQTSSGKNLALALIGVLVFIFSPDGSRASDNQPLDYIEVLTRNATAQETLPMVAVIHGLGDRPESFISFLQALDHKVRVILPRGHNRWGRGYAWFDRSDGDNWDPLSPAVASSAKRIADLLTRLASEKPTRGRPILSGFSQGGILSYAVASSHPESIQLAVPVSGLLPVPLWLKTKQEQVVYPRIRALHGSTDSVVPITFARNTVSHLKKIGVDAALVEYPVAHTISHAMHKQLLSIIEQQLNAQAK